jgi:protein gp37
MPSLLWACDMAELFLDRSRWVIDRVINRLAMSPDNIIGLILTKLPDKMAEYFSSLPEVSQQHCRKKLWLGFSAENPAQFDLRWPPMRELARQGYVIFVSIAPMIGPLKLPADFLALGDRCWAICSGEQGTRKDVRYMSPVWARAVRDQCKDAGVPFFLKQMSGKRPIPQDLRIWQFPRPARPAGPNLF